MKIRHTKLLCVMLSVFLLLGMLPAATAFAATSGTWGSGTHKISYAYADGILTISGNGDEITSPSNYTGSGSYLPWQNQSYTNSIEEVVFDAPNLAKIGGNAFKNLVGLKRISIPDTVTTIGWYAFQGCLALEDLYWPSSITAVDVYIFKDANVKRMHIDSLESIYSVGHLGAYNSALMDRVILQVALAEIISFPNIPVSVSINEYIEIAKMYSTPKSARYINGTLDSIVKRLTEENRLIKDAQDN